VNKLGLRLAVINAVFVLSFASWGYLSHLSGVQDAGRALLIPLRIDYPVSFLAGVLRGASDTSFYIGVPIMLVILGGFQWYLLGWGASNAFNKARFGERQKRLFWLAFFVLLLASYTLFGLGPLFSPATVLAGLALFTFMGGRGRL